MDRSEDPPLEQGLVLVRTGKTGADPAVSSGQPPSTSRIGIRSPDQRPCDGVAAVRTWRERVAFWNRPLRPIAVVGTVDSGHLARLPSASLNHITVSFLGVDPFGSAGYLG
jgi:hypothetical protein